MDEHRPIRLLIVDDHAVVREALAAILNQQPDMCTVAEADNGKKALELFHSHRPDVVLMDLRMPGGGGVGAIRGIRQHSSGARILVLTTYDGDEHIYQAIKAGAGGYLLKTAPLHELLEGIRRVNTGSTYIPPQIASKLAGRMNCQGLTRREQVVLELIAQGKNNQEIAQEMSIAECTVKAFINRIFSKLQVEDRTGAILLAIKRGLVDVHGDAAS